jgi:hypothetical protein
MRIRISAVRTAAGPGMAASVDEPLLNDHRAGLVTGHRAGVRTERGVSDFCSLGTSISPFYHHVFGIRGVDNFIRVAMEDDRRNGTSALWAA